MRHRWEYTSRISSLLINEAGVGVAVVMDDDRMVWMARYPNSLASQLPTVFALPEAG